MKGYPKHIATKQDFLNLLAVPDFREQALADLREIRDLADDTATRCLAIADDGTETTEQIPNPAPLYRIKGFAGRDEVTALIAEWEV